jgi:hypothetical protein
MQLNDGTAITPTKGWEGIVDACIQRAADAAGKAPSQEAVPAEVQKQWVVGAKQFGCSKSFVKHRLAASRPRRWSSGWRYTVGDVSAAWERAPSPGVAEVHLLLRIPRKVMSAMGCEHGRQEKSMMQQPLDHKAVLAQERSTAPVKKVIPKAWVPLAARRAIQRFYGCHRGCYSNHFPKKGGPGIIERCRSNAWEVLLGAPQRSS